MYEIMRQKLSIVLKGQDLGDDGFITNINL